MRHKGLQAAVHELTMPVAAIRATLATAPDAARTEAYSAVPAAGALPHWATSGRAASRDGRAAAAADRRQGRPRVHLDGRARDDRPHRRSRRAPPAGERLPGRDAEPGRQEAS